MFIPYKDDNPGILVPWVTWGILAVNTAVFILQLIYNNSLAYPVSSSFGTIPALLTGATHPYEMPFYVFSPVLTLFTSMFLHGGIMHILGNMLFLYVFADNIEGLLGHRKFLFFYLACGVIATLTQVAVNIQSLIPIIGASGAISGVMAGYLIKYPRARIHVLVIIFPVVIPAGFVVGIWFLTQFVNGMADLNRTGGGVAWFAHIGGFLAGSILMVLISKSKFKWRK